MEEGEEEITIKLYQFNPISNSLYLSNYLLFASKTTYRLRTSLCKLLKIHIVRGLPYNHSIHQYGSRTYKGLENYILFHTIL